MNIHNAATYEFFKKDSGAVAFRHNRIKNGGIVKETQYPFYNKRNFEEIKVEKLSFFLFFICFLFYRRLLNSRRTTVRLRSQTPPSYLNPFAPRFSLIKNSLNLYF